MWILLWLALGGDQNMDYFHIGTFSTKEECVKMLSKASVMVTKKTEAIECISVSLDDTYIRLKKK
tara:strand:- start:2868 stop:3062 length:195 start_codon:yes stop_codon:yes gene_type:complete